MYTTNQPNKPQRPKLQSFQAYESPSPSTPTAPGELLASCRALQSMLGGPGQQIQSPDSQPSYHPNRLLSRPKLQPPLLTPPCSSHKRGREDFEEDQMEFDVEENQMSYEQDNTYQTPKRQRFTSLDLPMGVHVADLQALQSPRTPQITQMGDTEMSLTPSHDVLELGTSSHYFPHSQHLHVQNTGRQDFWTSGRNGQLADSSFTAVDASATDQFDYMGHCDQNMLLDQQWMPFSGEANIGLQVR